MVHETLHGQRVLVTGHTGFKGTWLSLWLEFLGADVVGLSLPPEPGSLYSRAHLAGRWPESMLDIRDFSTVDSSIRAYRPDLVFHMAAQPLVSLSYADPMATFDTNVMGTMNVLEAVRRAPSVVGCVVVTTDKVYRPGSRGRRHVETDPLGASDPYSASKAAAEHVVGAWRDLLSRESGARVVAVRAGNVIGGGDFAANRLLPDLMRAFMADTVCKVRNPNFTRPWQHVLDPLYGYLTLGTRLVQGRTVPAAVNFGPEREESVAMVADLAARFWGGGAKWISGRDVEMPEAPVLALDSTLAHQSLGWRPTWGTEEATRRTVSWWRSILSGAEPAIRSLGDIKDFMAS